MLSTLLLGDKLESREVRSLWQGGSRRGRAVPTLRRTTAGGGASSMAPRVGRVGGWFADLLMHVVSRPGLRPAWARLQAAPDNTYIVGGRVVLRPCDPGLPFEFFIFSGLMLAAGFALALRIPRLRYTVASLILAGVFAGQWYVLTMDWQIDPTGHNLLPFEVILLAIFAAPAYLGAAVAHAVDASTKQQGEALSPGAEPSEP